MFNKRPLIQICTGLYIFCIALYMGLNKSTDFWVNYYWIVNKSAMFMCLCFNFKTNKSKSDWLFINFLVIQTVLIIIYFGTGLFLYYKWMTQNDAVIYSFVIGGFIAVLGMWLDTICDIKGLITKIKNKFRTALRRANK